MGCGLRQRVIGQVVNLVKGIVHRPLPECLAHLTALLTVPPDVARAVRVGLGVALALLALLTLLTTPLFLLDFLVEFQAHDSVFTLIFLDHNTNCHT